MESEARSVNPCSFDSAWFIFHNSAQIEVNRESSPNYLNQTTYAVIEFINHWK